MVQPAERILQSDRMVHADLVNLEIYAIYRAISELFGERGWDVIWRSGEIAFEQLRKDLNLSETEALPLMQHIGQWLVDVGYLEAIELSQPSEEEIDYRVEGAVCQAVVARLKAISAVLPYWSTVIMVAALKDLCGIQAEVNVRELEFLSPTKTTERLRLKRL